MTGKAKQDAERRADTKRERRHVRIHARDADADRRETR